MHFTLEDLYLEQTRTLFKHNPISITATNHKQCLSQQQMLNYFLRSKNLIIWRLRNSLESLSGRAEMNRPRKEMAHLVFISAFLLVVGVGPRLRQVRLARLRGWDLRAWAIGAVFSALGTAPPFAVGAEPRVQSVSGNGRNFAVQHSPCDTNFLISRRYMLMNKVALFCVCTISPLSPPNSITSLVQVRHL